jgi:cation diffusion facilitator CzcD-associated flavoprotein CzcO
MTTQTSSIEQDDTPQPAVAHFDAIVVGAGINGLYQLHLLREQGLSVRTLEAGSGVGGTWYWNRYPGARLDSESYSYAYFFSKELFEEWSWQQEFVGQPELESYFNFVADKFGFREDIDFNTTVTSASFDQDADLWRIETQSGRSYTSRFLVAAAGILSAPQFPDIPGLENFQGEWHHTGLWPKEPVDFAGKRVAIIGTGSSGIQVIQEIGPKVEHLTVFQRTPNWATPINNGSITQERMNELRGSYEELYAKTQSSDGCFIVDARHQSALDVSDEERLAHYEYMWNAPGLSFFSENFQDIWTDKAANDTLVEFLTGKIRARVKDPVVANKLIPRESFGMKRPPLENGYYEVFNQDHVDLVNLGDEPIIRFNAGGIETERGQLDVDIIIIATGFDAFTGAFTRMGIAGVGGTSLVEWWENGPRTYLGAAVHKFPNMFLIGPQGVAGNNPRCAERLMEWIAECIEHCQAHGISRIEATAASEQAWVELINEQVNGTILRDAVSWMWGSNVPGKARAFAVYLAPMTEWRATLERVAKKGYEGFELTAR